MSVEQELVLSVPDISCEHCVHTINGGLGKIAGIQSVTTDLPSKTVNLRYNPSQVSLQQIEAELDELGYTVAR